MSFLELAKKRKSIRKFLDKPVEQEKINHILKAVSLAPSAGNLQSYEVIVVRKPERIQQLYDAYSSTTLHENVKLVLVFLAVPDRSAKQYGKRGASLYSVQDATIACAYAQLAAADLGLGSVWIGAFDEKKVEQTINAVGKRAVAMLSIGYPASSPTRPPRRKNLFFEENSNSHK